MNIVLALYPQEILLLQYSDKQNLPQIVEFLFLIIYRSAGQIKNIRNLRKNEIDSNLRTAGSKDRKRSLQ